MQLTNRQKEIVKWRLVDLEIIPFFIVRILAIFSLIGLLALTGCDGSNSRQDLELFVKSVKKNTNKKADFLPEETKSFEYRYLGKGKRSPFVTPRQYVMSQVKDSHNADKPDIERKKEVLEQYELKDLKMVGTLKKGDGTYWGLVKDRENIVYKVTVGNYIGKNYGEILSVSDKEMEIKESITNGYDGWIINKVIMHLNE